MSPPRLSHYRQSRTGAGHERQVAAQQKVAGQQVSKVPTEPRRGQVIDLMAAFKASREKRRVAASTADKAKEKPAARGGAGRGPTRTCARHARRCNGGARRFGWLNRRPAFGTEGRGGTPRNRTRRDCVDDQQHDRREDLSEWPRARSRADGEGVIS
jgi:hypothetical protein